MIRTQLVVAVSAALLLLAGCGSGSDTKADTEPTASAGAPSASGEPSSSAPEDPAPTKASAEPAPTSSAPASTPTGELLDYETGDDSGIVLTTAADVSRLTGAPKDFRTFITAELANATPGEGCTEDPQIYVSRIDTGGWARGGYFIPQCGGYATLWAKSGGSWQDIWSGQSLVECATLTKHRVPGHIAGNSCLDGEDTVDYTG